MADSIEESMDKAAANALLEQMVEQTPCPRCKALELTVSFRLVAKPLGSFSLSGTRLKFSANEIPVITCGSCGVEIEGNVSRNGDNE